MSSRKGTEQSPGGKAKNTTVVEERKRAEALLSLL